jgi:lysophospholipase L1-like esterase
VRRRAAVGGDARGEGERRFAAFRIAACAGGALLALGAAEAALRAAGDLLPAGIAAERHDLGEATHDARWQPSPRYARRLRPRVDAVNEWRYGDIVRMGYVAPAVSPATLHRFRFVTDAEGFRNVATRPTFDVAALGDSFTDAMTMDAAASWPSQLERLSGVAVQNYGTAGFGPQQELLVLQDYVAAHRPRVVVLAFFAGNDLFDAEAFDDFQRSNGRARGAAAGWRIKDVFSRADTWYLVSAIKAAASWAAHAQAATAAEAAQPEPASQDAADPSAPAFDRGMFTALVAGRPIRWAFMPPYLNTLNFAESELRGRRGWALTHDAILRMRQTTAQFGGELVVMFLPFKSQVYWSLLERTLPRPELAAALRFYLDGNGRAVDIDSMRRNRLAQNRMLRELCEGARIPFLDTTPALELRLASGENVYFPDESHFNETGQLVVAEALVAFLRERHLVR